MDNPKPEKVAVVTEVKERIASAESVVVTEYRGLSVSDLAELRGALRPVGGAYKVYKNTLVRRAASDVGDEFVALLEGPTALAFTETAPDGSPGDVVTVTKVIRDFSKGHPELIIKGGIFEGQFIDTEGLSRLANVEPRDVLLARMAGAIAAPMTKFAGLLQALPRDFAYGLKALIDAGGAPGAPADEPVSEAPAPAPAEAEASPAEASPAEASPAEASPEETTEVNPDEESEADASEKASE